MKQKNIKPEDLVPFAQTVPYAMVDIVKKQQDGWIYVKLGF
jgi:intracellular sulfur oxidation DsrE/DsrF family protein